MPVITITSMDPILHVVAPVSLAAAAGTALVIDRDPDRGWPFPVGRLADLAASGPTAADLHPTSRGVALLGGPVDDEPVVEHIVDVLRTSWPAVVIRDPWESPSALRVEPALPWQPAPDVAVEVRAGAAPDGAIPTPPARLLRRILGGHIDPRWRWFRYWRPVWEQGA